MLIFSLKMRIHLVTIYLLIMTSVFYGQTVKGCVFNDRNKNLKREMNEPGIPGIVVSTLSDATVTNEQGMYQFDVDRETVIFVIKPAGFQFPLDDKNLPRFYYIHAPSGSPELKYPGVEPTGPLPAQLNFPLFETVEHDTFNAIIMGDPQPLNETELSYFRDDIVNELLDINASLIIPLGDIMFDDLSLYDRYKEIMGRIGCPVYNVPGNHDMNYRAKEDRFALETFKRHFGPPYYSFNYGKVHFVILDNVEYGGWREEQWWGNYRGNIHKEQLHWLEEELKFVPEDNLVVLCMHIPLYTAHWTEDHSNVVNREELFRILKNHKHVLALTGHTHTHENYDLGPEHGWKNDAPLEEIICGAACGAWWSGPRDERNIPLAWQIDGVPNGYFIFTFSNNTYTRNYYMAGNSTDEKMHILSPVGSVHADSLEHIPVVVNIYDIRKSATVKAWVDALPVPLEQKTMNDPYFIKLRSMHDETYHNWISPSTTDHIWTAKLPDGLEKGIHQLKIEYQQQDSTWIREQVLFEIIGK